MYLIDTSIWIEYLRQKKTPAIEQLNYILDKHIPFGLTSVIFQEILQAALTHQDFAALKKYFSSQRFYFPKDNIFSYEAAAKIYFDCKKQGITIRSTIDCLIAQIAIENELILFHHDKDFLQLSKISPQLKLFHFFS